MLWRGLGVATMLAALSLLMSPVGDVAAASKYQAKVQQNVCTRHGGAYGHGYALLKVKALEVGSSQTNYFKFKSRTQANLGVGWSTGGQWLVQTSTHFTDNALSYSTVVTRRYDFKAADWMGIRVQMKVQFWSDDVGLLTTKTVNSKGC
jgi:hypothetical protein